MTPSKISTWLAELRRSGYVRAICCLTLASSTVVGCAGGDEGGPSSLVIPGTSSNAGGAGTTGDLAGSSSESATTGSTTARGVTTVSGSESTASTSMGGASQASTTLGGLGAGGSGGMGGAVSTTRSASTEGVVGAGGAMSSSATVGTDGAAGTGGAVGTEGTETSGVGQGGTGGTGNVFDVCSTPPPQGTPVVTVHVIGDSTASIYGSDVYPRTGWGQVLGDYYAPACAVVDDKALSGRSSKSFYDEGAWTPVRDALAAGDFVLIQFGHNDEKSDDPTRYTDPQTTYKEYLTTYITDTRAKSATPVLVTPINRNNWNGTTLSDTHGDYPPAMRELAADLDVALIDLTALTKTYFESLGPAATSDLFMNLDPGEFPNYPDGNSDNTHLRESGARVIAELLNYDAYLQELPLATLLASVPTGP